MALDVVAQDSFGAGMWRATERQKAPQNAVYDVVNGLLDERDAIYRRGGSVYKGAAAAGAVTLLWDGNLFAGHRTVLCSGTTLQVLASDDTAVLTLGTLSAAPSGPAVEANGVLVIPLVNGKVAIYAGSRNVAPHASYNDGTASIAAGSTTVVGIGTSWGSPNTDAGMLLVVSDGTNLRYVPVESFPNGIAAKLREPSPFTGTLSYNLQNFTEVTGSDTISTIGGVTSPFKLASAGQRLLLGSRNRLYLADRNEPASFVFRAADNYLELQGELLGAIGRGNDAMVFTDTGIWNVANVVYDLLDDFGNVQQSVNLIDRETILWGPAGLAGWHGSIIVPALDAVYLIGSQFESLSEPIRPLYREYVEAGYTPGQAAVFRGHYFLPILDGSTIIDTLVCRLDGAAWSRLDGYGASPFAFARRDSSDPRLLAAAGDTRLVDLTGMFTPAQPISTDADGSVSPFEFTTRDFSIRRQTATLWRYARLRYELSGTGSPAIAAQKATGVDPALVSASLHGDSSNEWIVDLRAQAVRLRFSVTAGSADCRVRGLELFARQSGKR